MLSQITATADARALESAVPRSRFKRYRSAADGSLLDAARLYVIDAEARGAFLELIHFAEVALRDAFHGTLAANYGHDWFRGTRVVLDDRTREKFREAEMRVTIAASTPERIIAEASFGTWTDLLETGATSSGGSALAGRADYERDLWTGRLEILFANMQFSGRATRRQQAAALLRRVARLRNRVAHHESVIFGIHQPGERAPNRDHKRQLPSNALADVRLLIDTFCEPVAATWLTTCTHVDNLLNDDLAVRGLARIRRALLHTVWI